MLTGLTARSTTDVTRVLPVPADMVSAQLKTLFADVAVDTAKIGTASEAADAEAVLRDELLPLADVVTPNLPEDGPAPPRALRPSRDAAHRTGPGRTVRT